MSSNNRELSVEELAKVSGGIKGALEGVCRKDEGSQGGQNDPAQMFQQILNQLTQGQG
jgi:bacteriocin-like protein